MHKSFGAALVALMVGVPTVSMAATNFVLDGTFLSPPGQTTPPGFTTYFSGQMFGPWTVTGTGSTSFGGAGVDLIGPYATGGYWQAPIATDGSVDLDGDAPGGITQTISGLTAGDSYKLTFALSGNPDGSPMTKSVDVSIGSIVADNFTYTLTGGNSHADMLFQSETVQFVAGPSNTLSFSSEDVNSPYGPVVAEIAITSVPEASTWAMMLAGFAGLGFAGYRKARSGRTALFAD
jgi:hypothetical protein